jgi:ribosomal protein L32
MGSHFNHSIDRPFLTHRRAARTIPSWRREKARRRRRADMGIQSLFFCPTCRKLQIPTIFCPECRTPLSKEPFEYLVGRSIGPYHVEGILGVAPYRGATKGSSALRGGVSRKDDQLND